MDPKTFEIIKDSIESQVGASNKMLDLTNQLADFARTNNLSAEQRIQLLSIVKELASVGKGSVESARRIGRKAFGSSDTQMSA